MPEFDLHAAIKELARVEIPCVFSTDGRAGNPNGNPWHPSGCMCRGTGHIVPFVALRVDTGNPRLGWVPEPDVEKASARVHAAYPHSCFQRKSEQEFSAALAWVKEQQNDATKMG